MNDSNLENQFNVIYIIYAALILGQLLFFAVALYLVENSMTEFDQSVDGVFKILVPVIGIISMFVSYRLYNSKVSEFKENKNLSQKLEQYRTIKIIQWGMLEGAGFLSLVAFLLTGNYFYVIVLLFMIGFTILNRPSKENFRNDFKVTGTDKNLI